MDEEIILQVVDLKKYFPIKRGVFQMHVGDKKAVDGVSFQIRKGLFLVLLGSQVVGKALWHVRQSI